MLDEFTLQVSSVQHFLIISIIRLIKTLSLIETSTIKYRFLQMGCLESSTSAPELSKGRGSMLGKASLDQDILSHYLKYESSLTPLTSPDSIRRRMILEHNFIDQTSGKVSSDASSVVQTILMRSWIQRVFLECIDEAQIEYFQDKRPYDDVRRKICEKFLFELYQSNQFLNAGLPFARGNTTVLRTLIIPLSIVGLTSDSALYAVLKGLKQKFPQVADKSKIEFPKVEERKQDVNLFDNIPNLKSFSDPTHMNFNTTLFDIEFLIERALSEFQDFKTDMKVLLGEEVLADVKVKQEIKGDQKVYAASAVRRVFIKWVETLFERSPNIRSTTLFKKFITSKKVIFDGFNIGGAFGQSIQNTVLGVLLQLIEITKYTAKTVGKNTTYQKNPNFGFYIYDLLRCKIHRPTAEQIMKVLDSMCKTTKTSTGKKFKVTRIKNRFKTPNRDLMVNFQYGDVIIGQAQLCVDTSDVDEKAYKTNKFNHYLYELERGLFGPTAELMMQYEDFNKPEQVTRLYWMEELMPRVASDYAPGGIEPIKTKCPSGHEMIMAKENYFIEIPGLTAQQRKLMTYECDFCLQSGKQFTQPYNYCQKCSLFFCKGKQCQASYVKALSQQSLLFSCNIPTPQLQIKSSADLPKLLQAKKSIIVIFLHPDIPACIMLRDYMVLVYSVVKSKGVPFELRFCDITKPGMKEMADKYEIKKLPSSVVFDRGGKKLKTLIGASVQQMDGLDGFRSVAAKSTEPALQIKCNNPACPKSQPLQVVQAPQGETLDYKCFQCLGINVEDSFSGAFMQGFNEDKSACFACPECQSKYCLKCSYLGYPDPAVFQDPQGVSYMSAKLPTPKSVSDPNGHTLTVTHKNINRQPKYDCVKCNSNFFFNRQSGMGYCQQCSVFACPKCLGLDAGEINTRFGKDIACHFLEASAPQTKKCSGCKQNFKKVYSSRTVKEDGTKEEEQGFWDVLADTMKPTLREWKCCYCKDTFREGIAHIACIRCNYEMCLSCAQKAEMFRPPEKFEMQTQTTFTCPSGHFVKLSHKSPKPGQTIVECQCKRLIYPNSEHYKCDTCNKFWCTSCAGQHLGFTQLTCTKGHPLVERKRNPTGLAQYCGYGLGHIILKKQPFITCLKCEDFVFCGKGSCRGRNIPADFQQCPYGHSIENFVIAPRANFICSNWQNCYYNKKGKPHVTSDYLSCHICLDTETPDQPAFRLCWACMTGKMPKEGGNEEEGEVEVDGEALGNALGELLGNL